MNKKPFALQLYSVRNEMEKDFEGTLKAVKAFGYDGVEFAGVFDHSADEVKKMCSETGLVPVSAHLDFFTLRDHPEVIETYAEIGCKYIVIAWIPEEYLPTHEKYKEFRDGIVEISKKAKALGLALCYHNHDYEFKTADGERLLTLLYNDIPEDVLKTQLDTCWVNVGGENPAEYLRRFKGRAPTVHLKDYKGVQCENMYGLIGSDTKTEEKPNDAFELRPIGKGVQNIPEIIKAADDADSLWLIVEQDEPSMGLTPLECAKTSIEYLKSL